MKVKTLIKRLQTLPQNLTVVLVNTEWEDEGILRRVVTNKTRGIRGLDDSTVYLVPPIPKA